jgi:hypothetical protein
MCSRAGLMSHVHMTLSTDGLFECTPRSLPDTTRVSLTTRDLFLCIRESRAPHMYCKRDVRNFVPWGHSDTSMYFDTQVRKAAGQGSPLGWGLQLATERR